MHIEFMPKEFINHAVEPWKLKLREMINITNIMPIQQQKALFFCITM